METEILNNLSAGNALPLNPINIIDGIISLIFAGLFGWLITISYKYSSQSISGGRQIISSLLPLTLSICVIISIVKSSLALSLGLVGALSIVRFRTPIKDPEDLVYLFLAIVSGLGFGANQNIFTAFGISGILLVLAVRSFLKNKKNTKLRSRFDFNINLEWEEKNYLTITKLVDAISENCLSISFIRQSKFQSHNSLVLQVNLNSNTNIDSVINSLKTLDQEFPFKFLIQISIIKLVNENIYKTSKTKIKISICFINI